MIPQKNIIIYLTMTYIVVVISQTTFSNDVVNTIVKYLYMIYTYIHMHIGVFNKQNITKVVVHYFSHQSQ